MANNGPNGGPPPPPSAPPPPPPMGGLGAALTPETQAAVAQLQREIDTLKAAIAIGDHGAEQAYKELQKHYYNNWAETNKLAVINPQRMLDTKKEELTTFQSNAQAKIKELQEEVAIIQTSIDSMVVQKSALAHIPNSNFLLDDINHFLDHVYPTKQMHLAENINDLMADIEREKRRIEAETVQLNTMIRQGRAEVAQLAALKNLFPKPETPKTKAEGKVTRVFNLEEWKTKGLISGIFLENMRVFVTKKPDPGEPVDGVYIPDKKVIAQFNEFLKNNNALNEYFVLGVAAGFITRDYSNEETRFLITPLKPLENTLSIAEREPILGYLLEKLYSEYADLRQTAPIALAPNAASSSSSGSHVVPAGIGSIAQSIQATIARDNRNNVAPISAPSSVSSSNIVSSVSLRSLSSPSSNNTNLSNSQDPSQPISRSGRLAALEQRNQAAFQAGFSPVEAQRHLQNAVQNLDVFSKEIDTSAENLLKEMQELLDIGDVSLEETLVKATEKIKELEEKVETPATIIANEWGVNRQAALQHAYDASKKKGRALTDLDLLKLVPQSDKNLARALIPKIKK